jgi:ParB-like chromosome segregation protein Spo0J
MKIETVPIDSLKPDPKNPRLHGPRNVEAIKASLQRFGQQKPIVVDAAGVIRAGNGTWSAGKALGWKTIEIVRTALAGDEAVAYGVADNKAPELAEWDPDVLLALNVDLTQLSFTEGEIAELEEFTAGSDASGSSAKSDARGSRLKGGGKPVVRVMLAIDDLAEFEQAIKRTNKMNRSDAILELCRTYGHSERQLDVPAQVDAPQPGDRGGAKPQAGAHRARNARRPRASV